MCQNKYTVNASIYRYNGLIGGLVIYDTIIFGF